MAIDGRVTGLNQDVFAMMQNIKKRNPGTLTEADAKDLKAAIMKDGKLDAAENDLLDELTSTDVRKISISKEGAGASEPIVVAFPASGKARQILQEALTPKLDLEGMWNGGVEGFRKLTEASTASPAQHKQVVDFVAAKLEKSWDQSNMGNGYKPLRDTIGSIYNFATTAGGSSVNTGRTLLYESMSQVDQKSGDKIPDFLYNWVRPGGLI